MNSFLAGAHQLLDLAQGVGIQGSDTDEVHVLLGGECGTLIIMQANEDWTLEALRLHHGADVAYRVAQNPMGTRVEGISSVQSCSLGGKCPAEPWKHLMRCSYAHHFLPIQRDRQTILEAK